MLTGVHRIVESHAATRGNEIALVGREGTLTYRELNQRANALARHLIAKGLRRGSRAVVKMERCPDLAVVLLAVLKAGGAYTWLDGRVAKRTDKPALAERSASADRWEESGWPYGISLVQAVEGHEERHLFVDIRAALEASARPAPNLPILTRAADIACVLHQGNGLPTVMIPHSTITGLQSQSTEETAPWSVDLGALDMWLPLMAGDAITLTTTLTTAPGEAAVAA